MNINKLEWVPPCCDCHLPGNPPTRTAESANAQLLEWGGAARPRADFFPREEGGGLGQSVLCLSVTLATLKIQHFHENPPLLFAASRCKRIRSRKYDAL